MLADARSTHPLLWRCGSAYPSADYAPDQVVARCNQPFFQSGAVTYMVRKSADLRLARSFAVDYADWVGLSRGQHGGPADGRHRAGHQQLEVHRRAPAGWPSGGTTTIWSVKRATADGSTTRWWDVERPGARGMASRGLFLVNAMADLVRTHTTDRRHDHPGVPSASNRRRAQLV